MEVLYRSTRGNEESVSASKAILEGLASDGGLFVPQALPSFDKTLDCLLYTSPAFFVAK